MRIFSEYGCSQDKTILESDNLSISIQDVGWDFFQEKYRVEYVIKWKDELTVQGKDLFVPACSVDDTLSILETVITFMGNYECDNSELWAEYPQSHKDALENGMYEEMQYVAAMLQFAVENNRYYIEGIDD